MWRIYDCCFEYTCKIIFFLILLFISNCRVLRLCITGWSDNIHETSDIASRKEDFYEVQRLQQIPSYDVLITNPPYSDDHISRLMTFALNCNKPYFLLMPNFVYTKVRFLLKIIWFYYLLALQDYYVTIPSPKQPFYIVPSKRLQYTTPKVLLCSLQEQSKFHILQGRRQLKSSKYTSPFPSFWYDIPCFFLASWICSLGIAILVNFITSSIPS